VRGGEALDLHQLRRGYKGRWVEREGEPVLVLKGFPPFPFLAGPLSRRRVKSWAFATTTSARPEYRRGLLGWLARLSFFPPLHLLVVFVAVRFRLEAGDRATSHVVLARPPEEVASDVGRVAAVAAVLGRTDRRDRSFFFFAR